MEIFAVTSFRLSTIVTDNFLFGTCPGCEPALSGKEETASYACLDLELINYTYLTSFAMQ